MSTPMLNASFVLPLRMNSRQIQLMSFLGILYDICRNDSSSEA
jgi:hypothetical protein